jgi:deoxyadenosine/deoxycytidine kinase
MNGEKITITIGDEEGSRSISIEGGEPTVLTAPINTSFPSVPSPILISLEGSIGSGKSTLINTLRERNPGWHFIDEPVSTWQGLKNEAGEDLLQVFYKDIKRYSYTFQNCALLSRAINIQRKIAEWKAASQTDAEAAKNNVFITERCLETDYHVFAQMLRDDGMMDRMEWDLYKMWYDYIQTLSTPLTAVIYLYTPPDICADRIKIRGRTGEDKIGHSYLENLDKYQRQWLAHETIPILHYDNFGEGGQKNKVEDVEQLVCELVSKSS